jgi:hypothetical protein
LRAIFSALLFLFASGATAQSWECDGKTSQGSNIHPEAPITLVFDNEQVSLTTADYTFTSGKLDTKNGVSVYAEQEASDLSNERITTSRMFRLDLESGHLVFFDHLEDHLLITADCQLLK